MEKLNIGQFIDAFYPIVDGVVLVVNNYASKMNNDDTNCTVFAPKVKGYDDSQRNYKVIRASSMKLDKTAYVAAMPNLDIEFTKALRNTPLDIVHAHSPATLGNIAMDVAKKRKIPSVITFHSKYYEHIKDTCKSESIAKSVLKKMMTIYDKAYKVWPVSEYAGRIMREYGYTGEYEVIGNGTDMKKYQFTNEERENFDRENNLNSNIPLFLFVGQIINYKNVKFSIYALKLLKDRGYKFRFVLIGEGDNRDEIINYAESLNMMDCIEFKHKIVDRTELSRWYSRADLFLFPSKYEMASLVHLEAASCGLPSAVINNTSLSECVEDGVTGFVCEDNVETYADMIEKAIADKDRLKAIGENAKQRVKTFDDIAKEVTLRYRDIIKEYNQKRENEK